MSEGVSLLDELYKSKKLILYFDWGINPLIFKYLGLISSVFVITGFLRNFFFPIYTFSLMYILFMVYSCIGSYGLWGFYFIPLTVLWIGFMTKKYQETYKILVFMYVVYYFSAGFSKIFPIWEGIVWVKSFTIENLLLNRQEESILYVAGIDIFKLNPLLVKIGIYASVILEISAILILFSKKFWFLPFLLLSFHFLLFLTGTPGIIEYAVAALVFIPDRFINFLNEKLLYRFYISSII
ncbi:MAG: hypothetical protein SNJ77_05270 [Cytophagales bacterium]